MPFAATVHKVMIASPGDLEEERAAVTETVGRWNYENAARTGVVYLPIRWETHAVPSVGRPQSIINTQLVDTSDILIALFWTRIGTPTGMAASGTAEEIGRFAEAGKRVLLYYSDREISPSQLNKTQMNKLKKFKDSMRSRALSGDFSSKEQLTALVYRHLTSLSDDAAQRPEARPHSPPRSAAQVTIERKFEHLYLIFDPSGGGALSSELRFIGAEARGKSKGSAPAFALATHGEPVYDLVITWSIADLPITDFDVSEPMRASGVSVENFGPDEGMVISFQGSKGGIGFPTAASRKQEHSVLRPDKEIELLMPELFLARMLFRGLQIGSQVSQEIRFEIEVRYRDNSGDTLRRTFSYLLMPYLNSAAPPYRVEVQVRDAVSDGVHQ